MRRHGWPLLWAIACGLVLAAPAAATPYRLLVERDGLRVFVPASERAWGTCPRDALPVSRADVQTARRAVLLAMPKLYSGRGRGYRVVRSTGAGIAPFYPGARGAKSCSNRIFRRTVVVDVVFPRIGRYSASLSQATFLVARLRDGWVIWGQPH